MVNIKSNSSKERVCLRKRNALKGYAYAMALADL